MPNEPEITYVSGFTLVEPSPQRYTPPKPAPGIVTLRGIQVSLTSDVGSAFVSDLARNKERLFSDARVIEKYDIQPADWTQITQSKTVRLLVNAEHERRMLNGDAAREAAAKQFTKAPEILGEILEDQKASPRHRVDAARELRATARFDDKKDTADVERFTITINLGNAPEDKIFIDAGPLPLKQAKEASDAEKEW
jgi:hypothetical protein